MSKTIDTFSKSLSQSMTERYADYRIELQFDWLDTIGRWCVSVTIETPKKKIVKTEYPIMIQTAENLLSLYESQIDIVLVCVNLIDDLPACQIDDLSNQRFAFYVFTKQELQDLKKKGVE